MSEELLSLPETETSDVKCGRKKETVPASFAHLPAVVIQHLSCFLPWSSRRTLAQLNARYRLHFENLLREADSLSVKGHGLVGVGPNTADEGQSASFLFEFFTIQIRMDAEVSVDWTLKFESGVRTVVQSHRNANYRTKTTKTVCSSSRNYLEMILKGLLEKYHFKKIHLGVNGLAPLFNNYKHQVDDLGVSDEKVYLRLAERLQPKKLTLFLPSRISYEKGTLDLTKFPRLESLHLYGIPLNLDQFLNSNLVEVTSNTIENEINVKDAKRIIENWKFGISDYKMIKISSAEPIMSAEISYSHWSEYLNHSLHYDSLFDEVQNTEQKTGWFRYSPKCFEFEIPQRI